jgi:general secretion pathway protein N
MAGCEMISRSTLRRLAGAFALAAAPSVATAIVQTPGTEGTSVRADLGPTPRIKSGELDRAPPTGNPLWAIALKDLNETRDRPIFTPSRRPPPRMVEKPYTPPPPPPRVETQLPPEPLTLSLVGTIAGESDGVALFTERGTQEVVRLRTGESHHGWVLRSVQGREAMLEKGDRKETVMLPPPGGAAAGGAPGITAVGGAPPSMPAVGGPPQGMPPVGPPGMTAAGGAPPPGMSGAPVALPENGRRPSRR